MEKKLLLLIAFFIVTISFSQEEKSEVVKLSDPSVSSITDITAFPNPFVSQTTIYFNATQNKDVLFSVKNLLGKRLYHKTISVIDGKNSFTFRKNKIPPGMYIYSFQTEKNIISKRFVIK